MTTEVTTTTATSTKINKWGRAIECIVPALGSSSQMCVLFVGQGDFTSTSLSAADTYIHIGTSVAPLGMLGVSFPINEEYKHGIIRLKHPDIPNEAKTMNFFYLCKWDEVINEPDFVVQKIQFWIDTCIQNVKSKKDDFSKQLHTGLFDFRGT